MTLEFRDKRGTYLKQWPNWEGKVPQKGDIVIVGEDNTEYIVIRRVIDGKQSDKVVVVVDIYWD